MCSIRDVTHQFAIQESLRNSQQRFLALADNMAQLAWMADETGYIFWYNQRWFEYTGTTMAEMEGWGWKQVHHPEYLDRVVNKFAAHIASGEVWEDIFPLRSVDGHYRWFLSRAMPIRDEATGRIALWCGTNTDITEQRNATQRLRQKARLIELSHEAIFSWDLDGAILTWNRGCEELYGFSVNEAIGSKSHDLLKSQHPVSADEIRTLLLTDGAWSGEILHVAKDGTKVWVDSRHEVLHVGGKAVVLETNRDITERRKSDEIRSLLIAELNHRVKNTLAIVQSIASQTARSSKTMAEYAEALRGRLQSLASAHNVLTDAHWYGADLRTLVESEIDATVGDTGHVRISGDSVFLPPQTALHFTLMFHELATNALKHGALSVPNGTVEVSWRRKPDDAAKLELLWRERGGPLVKEPTHNGFGTTLISRSGRLPNITASLTFDSVGVECRIEAALQHDDMKPVMFNPVRKESPLAMAPRAKQRNRAASTMRVLLIEPEPSLALELQESLNEAGLVPVGPVMTIEAASEAIARGGADVAIVDGDMIRSSLQGVLDNLTASRIPYLIVSSQVLDSPAPVVRKPVRTPALLDALASVLPTPAEDDVAS
jgi:PAS domain S-box-containing protein